MKILRIVGLLIGLSLAGYLLHEVGWAQIKQTFEWLGWGYPVVILYPVTWMLCNTAGWRSAIHAQYAKINLLAMMAIRITGEAFNSLLPSGYVGGEPLKAKLLSNRVPPAEAASSVLIAKAAQSVSLIFFIVLGLSLGGNGASAPLHRPSTLVSIGCLTVGIFIFTLLLTRRSFSRVGRWLHRLTGHPWLQKQDAKLVALDDSIGAFYRECKGRFFQSILWHGGGWLAGALEVAIICWFLGTPVTWRQAWFIGALAQLAAIVGLLIPAGIGLYEGGHYMAASILGLPPSLGLSVSLIRRMREIVWDTVGLYLFWKLSKESTTRVEST